jgi:hypothetical protein
MQAQKNNADMNTLGVECSEPSFNTCFNIFWIYLFIFARAKMRMLENFIDIFKNLNVLFTFLAFHSISRTFSQKF